MLRRIASRPFSRRLQPAKKTMAIPADACRNCAIMYTQQVAISPAGSCRPLFRRHAGQPKAVADDTIIRADYAMILQIALWENVMELSELVQRIRRGDREALRELIAQYGAGVYRKAYQKTQDKDLAREATRRTFAQLVTTLQEQADMDGWELWLNALAKRNIEACSNLRADMAYMEGELNRELFAEQAPAARLADGKPAPAPMQAQEPISAFWQEGPCAAQEQASAQRAAEQAAVQRAAEQAAVQRAAEQAAAQHAAEQAAAQRAAEQAAVQRAAQEQARKRPSAPEPLPPRATAQRNSSRQRKHAEPLFDEKPPARRSGAAAVVLLAILCVILAWMAVVISMSLGLIPKIDLGYNWFNTHIARFF